jgi:four helix bundle protein
LAADFQRAALAKLFWRSLALAHALAHSGDMKPQFDHEKLNVYRASLEFITWTMDLLSKVDSKAAVKDHLDRASTSVPLNIAEGNGKFAIRDRCRFLDFARGSALECAACLDVLVAKRLTDVAAVLSGKQQLFEIVSDVDRTDQQPEFESQRGTRQVFVLRRGQARARVRARDQS